jgi:hypothetical protein
VKSAKKNGVETTTTTTTTTSTRSKIRERSSTKIGSREGEEEENASTNTRSTTTRENDDENNNNNNNNITTTYDLTEEIKAAIQSASLAEQKAALETVLQRGRAYKATADLLADLHSQNSVQEEIQQPLHRANTKEFIARLLSPTQSAFVEPVGAASNGERGFLPPGVGKGGEQQQQQQQFQLAARDQLFLAKKRLNEALAAIEKQKSLEKEEEEKMTLFKTLPKKRKRGADANANMENTTSSGADTTTTTTTTTATTSNRKTKKQDVTGEQQPAAALAQKEKKSSTRKGVFGAIPASGDKANASKPKRADRRRTIARFTTAILRAEGSHVFISRDGLGYRKAFDKFLAQTYGKTFDVNGYWWTNARVEPFLRLLVHIASEGSINISEKDASELFKKKDERQAAEWVLDEDKLAKCANGMTAKDLAAIFEGKPRKTKKGFVRGTPLLVPTDKETLPVDAEAVKKAEEEKKMATENRSKIRSEKKAAAAAASAAAKTTTSTGSKEKRQKATATETTNKKASAAQPTNSNTGSVLTDGVLPGRSRTPNFFQQPLLPSQKSINAMMMLPPSPKPTDARAGTNNPPSQQGFRATSSVTPPPDVTRLFQNVPGFGAVGSNNASSNSLLMLGSRPGSRQGAIAAAGVARQYSSDLSRMMSEFNTDPESSNLFLSSYNALSASELDAVAATMATNPALKRGMSRRQPSTIINATTANATTTNANKKQ